MVDDDTFTYHVKQQPAGQINKPAHSLITKERTQKLDLLIHLLSNLTQALVVCGPEGIGKTTLLKILQERNTESWRYCLIQGNAAVSFEAIQEQLLKSQSVQPLSAASARPGGQYNQVVLVIDNAGALVPGLITAIIHYAAASPFLRVVFALTHDELQVKRVSDRAIDDCHVIEIPSLSEKQCGDFLQHLSTKPYANVSFKAIGDNMVAHIYRETHGIPGRIIDKVSGLSAGAKPSGKLKRVLVFAFIASIAIAVGVQWLISSKDNHKKAMSPVVEQKANSNESAPPKPESRIMLPLPPAKDDGRDSSRQSSAFPPSMEGRSAAIGLEPMRSPTQHSANEAKDALEPESEVNTSRDDSRSAASAVNSEAASVAADKPSPSDAPYSSAIAPASQQLPAEPMPLSDEQKKPKQSELTRTASNVEQPAAQNLDVKGQFMQAAKVGEEQKQDKKQPDGVQQKTADQLWAAQEKLKQTESKKNFNSAEPVTPIQLAQKPVKAAAIPEVQTTETASPLQSVPTASLPASAGNFTLQLMVLSKQSSADEMRKKYPALGPDIKIIRTVANGKEKFILEYGSYPDAASANKARESLPFEFHRALVRKIVR